MYVCGKETTQQFHSTRRGNPVSCDKVLVYLEHTNFEKKGNHSSGDGVHSSLRELNMQSMQSILFS